MLVKACKAGKANAVVALLESGAIPHEGNLYSCLSYANITLLMVQYGADARMAMYWASRYGHYDTVIALLKYGATADNNSAMVAYDNGHADIVFALLAAGAELVKVRPFVTFFKTSWADLRPAVRAPSSRRLTRKRCNP